MIHLLDVFFPKTCIGCGKWGSYFCDRCKKSIQTPPYLKCPICEKPAMDGITHPYCKSRYALDGLMSFYRYDGVVKSAIKKLKYQFVSDLTHELFDCISPDSFTFFTKILKSKILNLHSCSIVPIPLHPSRERFRGFNQAKVIGGELSKRMNIPLLSDVLVRVKKTTPQVEMTNRKKRLDNMNNVFSIHKSHFISHNSCVLLVDDVFTTGATLRSAGGVLKRAGVKMVWGVTIAQ